MASLNKLAIRGIRSFDDKQIAVIEFFSPVTVIVGHNGSGKTTVIECLKYATTGDQPPGTRGGAFVHDPKMANEKEVKAQVKLRFHAANGQRMLAVRNLSVSMKKTAGMTMKTLESILALADGNADKGGKRGVISTKCAEMDIEIPNLLGVSKSVLENVIFCHQEDSYWPLAEPAALKKKFDDIFEATRYTKALDSIKSLRKDRTADLKADKERLASLAREKAHADKMRARHADLNSTIASKEIAYEEAIAAHRIAEQGLQRLQTQASKFREVYARLESLQKQQERYTADLADAKTHVKEEEGTDAELQARLDDFESHVAARKQVREKRFNEQRKAEEDLAQGRREHVRLITALGEHQGEAHAQETRLSEREELIRQVGAKHGIRGFDRSPLERAQVVDFLGRLDALQRKTTAALEAVQAEKNAANDTYNKKNRELHAEVEAAKAKRDSVRSQAAERQKSLKSAELRAESMLTLPTQLRTLEADIEDRTARAQKLADELRAGNFDGRTQTLNKKLRDLEEERENLNAEFGKLHGQADARAKLDINRGQERDRAREVKTTLDAAQAKFRRLVGIDARVETMEREVKRVQGEKEREVAELEEDVTRANRKLQDAESRLQQLKTEVSSAKEEIKKHDKAIREGVEGGSLAEAIKEASEELSIRREESGSMAGTSEVYETLLKTGKAKKVCTACNRHLNDAEMKVFEKYLKEQMKKSSPERIKLNKEETEDWEKELGRLQALLPLDAARVQLRNTKIPQLERDIKDVEGSLPALTNAANECTEKVDALKKDLKDVSALLSTAEHIVRMQSEVEKLRVEIKDLEADLAATGSMRTTDDVQQDLDRIRDDIRKLEREKASLGDERERLDKMHRDCEKQVNELKMKKMELGGQLRDKTVLEDQIRAWKEEISGSQGRIRELEAKISDAQAPIAQLDKENEMAQTELNARIAEAQDATQTLNRSCDKLNDVNKAIERYVREKRAQKLKDCQEQVDEYEASNTDLVKTIEKARSTVAEIDKEIHASGATTAMLRENLRMRRLSADIRSTQREIDELDVEEAAKAKRHFTDKWEVEKKREQELQQQYSHIGGELASHKAQLGELETDLKEFKDITKKYTDQLLKVKMSEMANSDLEKYAKALDNAIMKYHSLKMEEVNDIMRHLWNKTYQGTDIDGIKIRSDVEGGASKRSYNYRVVMTKDQVEMDMRGRCSAGQKMLASIIIRLALSDSFGQNCGILALDEPTNALDIENIDALAASLVDIINERKNHSNFQLIIITHDENFLRKLGQGDVMEYYWRVSRDARQKSVIERQRFR